jgi:hypothetical protein
MPRAQDSQISEIIPLYLYITAEMKSLDRYDPSFAF